MKESKLIWKTLGHNLTVLLYKDMQEIKWTDSHTPDISSDKTEIIAILNTGNFFLYQLLY
jgi:hypothetical protein